MGPKFVVAYMIYDFGQVRPSDHCFEAVERLRKYTSASHRELTWQTHAVQESLSGFRKGSLQMLHKVYDRVTGYFKGVQEPMRPDDLLIADSNDIAAEAIMWCNRRRLSPLPFLAGSQDLDSPLWKP
eukprot:4446755-Karenia_brevis.AAC.1